MNKVSLVVGVLLLGGLGIGVWQSLNPAPATQGHTMVPPDTSKIAQGEPIADVRLPAQLSDDAVMGKRVYESACATCHGENAAGQNGVAPPLVHKIYEPGHHSDEAFQSAAKNGVTSHHWKFGNMPPVEGLTRADVIYIARYVRELQQENGIN